MGIGSLYTQDRWSVETSLQTEGVGSFGPLDPNGLASGANTGGQNRSGRGNTNWEVNGRLAGLPYMADKTHFLHTAISGSYIDLNKNYGGVRFNSQPNTSVDRTAVLNTGFLGINSAGTGNDMASLTRFGAEGAFVYGPFSAQTEYMQVNTQGGSQGGQTVDGYYGLVTYTLTGESRPYKGKHGVIGKLKPAKNFSFNGGGWGAWELAAGYDSLDLIGSGAKAINGGRMDIAKFGVNWYLNPQFMIKANYIHTLDINTSGANNATARSYNNQGLDIFDTRIQWTF
jgi:phosphate-selective porin OprO/OprP